MYLARDSVSMGILLLKNKKISSFYGNIFIIPDSDFVFHNFPRPNSFSNYVLCFLAFNVFFTVDFIINCIDYS